MSTRCVVTFKDSKQDGGAEHSVYKHTDGYPDGEHGIKALINLAQMHAWPLPRFEADEYAAAFVKVAKEGAGDVRLSSGPAHHGDLAYSYVVTQGKDRKLHIKVKQHD